MYVVLLCIITALEKGIIVLQTFEEFNLPPLIARGVQDQGYTQPTPIQALAIPALSSGNHDKIGLAQTGTGKTAAFVIPLLSQLDASSSAIQALILTPTRELAYQVGGEISKISTHTKLRSALVYGGVPYPGQIRSLNQGKPQIVVGTPGRILDLIDRKVLKLSQVKFCILDEADEMLNMGFLEDVKSIFTHFAQKPQLWMFSATMSTGIKRLIKQEFNQPEFLQVEGGLDHKKDIEQTYYFVQGSQRREALLRLILNESSVYGLIFCQTKLETVGVAQFLQSKNLAVEVLNGDLTQAQRDVAMKRFRKKQVQLMVCTDVAARGIDIENLTHVFNYNLPNDLESYTHRIGRTGRNGLKGKAMSLVSSADIPRLRKIQHTSKVELIEKKIPDGRKVNEKLMQRQLENLCSEQVGDLSPDLLVKMDQVLHGLERDQLYSLIYNLRLKSSLNLCDETMTFQKPRPEKKEYKPRSRSYGRKPRSYTRRRLH